LTNSFKLQLAAQFLFAGAMNELQSITTPPAQQAGPDASKIEIVGGDVTPPQFVALVRDSQKVA
jgi:hypothetical protein